MLERARPVPTLSASKVVHSFLSSPASYAPKHGNFSSTQLPLYKKVQKAVYFQSSTSLVCLTIQVPDSLMDGSHPVFVHQSSDRRPTVGLYASWNPSLNIRPFWLKALTDA